MGAVIAALSGMASTYLSQKLENNAKAAEKRSDRIERLDMELLPQGRKDRPNQKRCEKPLRHRAERLDSIPLPGYNDILFPQKCLYFLQNQTSFHTRFQPNG